MDMTMIPAKSWFNDILCPLKQLTNDKTLPTPKVLAYDILSNKLLINVRR